MAKDVEERISKSRAKLESDVWKEVLGAVPDIYGVISSVGGIKYRKFFIQHPEKRQEIEDLLAELRKRAAELDPKRKQ